MRRRDKIGEEVDKREEWKKGGDMSRRGREGGVETMRKSTANTCT